MDFKLPNNNFNENQIKLLENIQLSQKNILAQILGFKQTHFRTRKFPASCHIQNFSSK